MEQCIVEKEQGRSGRARFRGPQLISWEDQPEGQVDILAAEFIHPSHIYTYPTLTPSKGKEVAKPEKEMYVFDISKID